MSKQEHVAHVYRIESNGRPAIAWDDANGIEIGTALYTAPPKREWIGLTDEEIWSNGSRLSLSERGIREFARAIEAKLKEKNT